MIEFKDEILNGEPRYNVRDDGGNLIHGNVSIELSTEVTQPGTPLNKALFDKIQADLIPRGLICMWSGSQVPTGWFLCNGENGTPDLRNRFVVGSGDSYEIGNTGGSNTVTLSTANLPSHNHSFKVIDSTTTKNIGSTGSVLAGEGVGVFGGTSNDTSTINTTSVGSGTAHENRPPYYALAYIMKG